MGRRAWIAIGIVVAAVAVTAALIGGPRVLSRWASRAARGAGGAASAGSLDAYPWLATPKQDLAITVDVDLGNITSSGSMLWGQPGITHSASGNLQVSGPRSYSATGKACILVWTSTEKDETRAKSEAKPFCLPLEDEWLPKKQLAGKVDISGNLGMVSLQDKDKNTIIFRDPVLLGTCSEIIHFSDGGAKRDVVYVSGNYEKGATETGGAGYNTKYKDLGGAFWPYDRTYLEAVQRTNPEGSWAYETAHWLLDQLAEPPGGK